MGRPTFVHDHCAGSCAFRSRDEPARIAGVGVNTFIATALAIATIWLVVRPGDVNSDAGSGTPITYTSTRRMAQRIGCADSFTVVRNAGSATNAGQCRLGNGTEASLRVYPLADEATAWLDGARGPESKGAGVSAESWAAFVDSRDLATINSVSEPLTTN